MNNLMDLPDRKMVLAISCGVGCFVILLLTLILGHSRAAQIILDRNTMISVYPFTIQNLMHLFFFIGIGELFVRWRVSIREQEFLQKNYLPEDDATVLQAHDLGQIRIGVANEFDGEHGFLPSLIDLCILQYQASRSVDQVVSVLNSSLELIEHRVDLRYSVLRYLVWVIPTFGFIGTVVGISYTLSSMNPAEPDLGKLTLSLGVSFDTTLIALILSAILVFGLNMIQQLEEKSVNNAGHYTLKNLINRLYTGAY